jgi:pepF/M3 family oligoendopeptidase
LDSEAFRAAEDTLQSKLDELDAYMTENGMTTSRDANPAKSQLAQVMGGYLDRMNGLQRLMRTLQVYVWSFVTTDSYNTVAKRAYSQLEMLGVRGYKQGLRFQAWLGKHGGALPETRRYDVRVQNHAFYLVELVEQSQFMMSEAEEELAAELSLSGGHAWQRLQGTVTSQLTVPFQRNGKTEQLPITAVQNLRHDPDEEIRRRAYETELAAWESVREPVAAALNGVKGQVRTLDERRGRPNALDAALDASRIDRDTLDVMLGVMRDAFPNFRRYLQAKAGRLGRLSLPWWDLFAPVGRTERHFSFEQARSFIVTEFAGFSDRLAALAQRAFDEQWIDAEPRSGKRGGAFCMSVPGVEESRILCNFDGSLDQVFTLAHELGHAFHNECRREKTMLQRITPMTLAETASIFCETIVTDAALASATSSKEELAILDTFLVSATQVIVDISSRFQFEQQVFERRAQAELSADDFCELMLEAQRDTYGDGLDQDHLHPYMWAGKPHYYRPTLSFYNYPYAFGLLFSLGLYAIYRERAASFIPQYEDLLASTGEGSAADLAARFGIDIRERTFWEDSMALVKARIERYLAL